MNLEPLGYKSMAFCTVYEMACFFVTFDGNVPVTLHYKFQQSVHMTVVVPRPQFIHGVGHCSYVPETGIPLLLTVQKTVKIPLCGSLAKLLRSRCCATTGAGLDSCLVEVPVLQSTVVEIPIVAQRQFGLQTARKPLTFHGQFFSQFQV